MKLIDIFQKLDESSVNEVHSHDDYEDCDACNGTGEGRWEGETCHACHGSGVQKPEHDDDDFDIPDDDDFDGGDEESYYEKSLRSRGLEEGTSNVGNAIKSLCQKIYAAGDDEFEYFYHDSPVFAQYWDEYEGDLDSIIAEVDPGELQVMLDELESYVQQANLAEGDVAKLAGITALGIGAGLGANYLDQQQPRVEFDGKNGQVVKAYLEPGYSNRIPDNAMVIKGKDGKTYHVWSSAGKGMNSKSYHAAPVEPVKEGADDCKQNALWAQITAHEKAAKKSKDLKQQHHLKMADQLRSQLKTSDNVEEGLTKLPNGNYRNMHTGVQQSKPPVKKKRGEKTGAEWDAIEKAKKHKEQGVAEGSESECPRCHSTDIKTYSDGEKECHQCHKTWDVQGVAEGYDDEEHPIRDDGNEGRPGKQRYPGKLKTKGVAEGEQHKGADYRDPPEADYGDDYQAMVARVKKLAGLGPLKTVYDPQKRVYKNVPTAVQPKK